MQRYHDITLSRLKAFESSAQLGGCLYSKERLELKLSRFAAPGRISFEEASNSKFEPCELGVQFGPLWSTHWVKVEFEIPKNWLGKELHLLWDSVSEACVWQNGIPLQGLTGSDRSPEPIRAHFVLPSDLKSNSTYCYFIEVACNGLFGITEFGTKTAEIGRLKKAEIAVFDRDAFELLSDFKIIAHMAHHLPQGTPRWGQAIQAANEIVNSVYLEDRTTLKAGKKIAEQFLNKKAGQGSHELSAIGHAHIDTAWLWPLAETKRKCVRTFSSALRCMEAYPEYLFVCSQAQHLDWMKGAQPTLYSEIKQRAAEKRFVPTGGSWVEPDCNIPCAESLIRQFLYGQHFYQKEFGERCEVFWNPDVFGYSAALPQILNGVGIKYFLTQKLSWNQFNKPRASTFVWEGIDGSRVLTHFPPANTYNSLATVAEVTANVAQFKDADRSNESYLLFGHGDGGGGPTWEMLQNLRRMENTDGLPRVTQRTPQEFFKRCEKNIQSPLVWVGELYFELHRGTYTSQAKTKKLMRQCEVALKTLELVASSEALLQSNKAYPQKEIESLWKTLLVNQFHDILPGSSISEVHSESEGQMESVLHQCGGLMREFGFLPEQDNPNKPMKLFNPSCVEQIFTWGNGAQRVGPLSLVEVEGTPVEHFPGLQIRVEADGYIFENCFVRAKFNKEARLISLVYEGREFVPPGEVGNRFQLYEDVPLRWDAWDVDIFHLEKPIKKSLGLKWSRVTEDETHNKAVEFCFAVSDRCEVTQKIRLRSFSQRIEFETKVDWRERHAFLKVEFPLAVRAQRASFEIQNAVIERPTHSNTTWDMAQFEVSAHRFADLSDAGAGVALLNNCKYGYSVRANVMCLSLLRAPKDPDPNADMGVHHFSYALFPHLGDWRSGNVLEEAISFNVPVQPLEVVGAKAFSLLASVTNVPGVFVDSVKKAEDDNSVVIRCYEAYGRPVVAELKLGFICKKAMLCNMLEDAVEEIELCEREGGGLSVMLPLKNFQNVTVRFWL